MRKIGIVEFEGNFWKITTGKRKRIFSDLVRALDELKRELLRR